ncbi:SDR family NAD(P)-dependent oxidoreductase, partial [Microbacteriaceae bacterium K1510]|nr:SDR family NAD(P)-dependent oxidoreductase [Microbacteriaceae bacterium K1510]
MLLTEKIALITGAASGIGLEIARTFAESGAKVVVSDLNGEAAKAAAAQLQAMGHEAIGVMCDVTKEEQFQQSID